MGLLENLRRIEDIEKKAESQMNETAKVYYSAEATTKKHFKKNEKALARYLIKPRMLRDVSSVETETSLLGFRTPYPIAVAPTGLNHLAHPEAECAVARACEQEGLIMTASLVASSSVEEIAQAAPHSTKWLQIYICADRNITCDAVKRAENNGFRALVLTVDTPVRGLFRNHLPQNFPQVMAKRYGNKLPKQMSQLLDPSLTFKDIKWLTSITNLPIVVKGILRGDDAVEAVKHGASAVIVSNHGARQIDGVCPTIYALEEVVKAVKDYGTDVYVDGGFRTGSDIFRALALGAKAVFIGRPILWGLSVAGEDGVRQVLKILKNEFRATMSLAGTASLGEISRDMIINKGYCSKL